MIDLRVLQNDLTTEVAVLDVDSARHGLSWVDSVLDQGGANFEIPHTSPVVAANPTLFTEGNVIQIRDGGTPLFAFEVERPRRDAGDVSDRIAVAGPGALALLDHALVQLPTDQARLKNRQRVFGWMSTDFDASAWDSPIPYSGGPQSDPDRTNRRNRPEEWSDPDAQWLWSSAVDGSGNHPIGNSYFRWELDANTLGAGPYLLDIVGDNLFVAYFDGDQVADGTDWRGFATVEVELVAGVTHVLAVEVRNTRQSGGIMWSLAEFVDDEEERGDVVARTGDTPGRSIDYPADVPGVTHGFVLKTLFDEAQARGALNAVSIDFDAAVDSDGEPWADEIEMTLQAGNDSLLTAADRMRDWPVEFRMDPATFTFQAFQRAGVDRGQTPDGGLTTVTIPKGRAAGRSWEADGKTYDVLTVETQFDWGEVDGGSPPATNRREGFLSLAQSPTLALALKQAEKVRQLYATRREQVTFQTSSGTPGPQPYSEYGVGDVIEAPTLGEVTDADWTGGDLRVDTVTATLASGGHITWTHQAVDARIRSTLERLLTSREALGDGTLGGRTKVPTSPMGGGRGAAQASRKGGGGASDPRTLSVEADFQSVEPDGHVIEWQRAVPSARYVVRFPEPTYPAEALTVPSDGVWEPRVELGWEASEIDNDWRGGGEVRLRVDDQIRWPIGEGTTRPRPNSELVHPEYESNWPPLELEQGEQVSVEVDHDHPVARTMERALFSLTQIEPFGGGVTSERNPDGVIQGYGPLWFYTYNVPRDDEDEQDLTTVVNEADSAVAVGNSRVSNTHSQGGDTLFQEPGPFVGSQSIKINPDRDSPPQTGGTTNGGARVTTGGPVSGTEGAQNDAKTIVLWLRNDFSPSTFNAAVDSESPRRGTILRKGNSTIATRPALWWEAQGGNRQTADVIRFQKGGFASSGDPIASITSPPLVPGRWYMVTITHDTDVSRMWIDNTLVGESDGFSQLTGADGGAGYVIGADIGFDFPTRPWIKARLWQYMGFVQTFTQADVDAIYGSY